MLWSRLCAAAVLQIALSCLAGRIAIPFFRKLKTGKLEPYIGDRFKTDGSEPAFGGANMLLVFVFGGCITLCFTDKSIRAAAVFILILTLCGIAEDTLTDVFAKPYGIKGVIKLGLVYSSCLALTLVLNTHGVKSGLLLPFHLGYLAEGLLPLRAAVMTGLYYSFTVYNRLGTDEESCIGGLSAVTLAVGCLFIAVSSKLTGFENFGAYCYSAAGAAAGGLLWGLYPSKQRYGSSGGAFCAAAAAGAYALSGRSALIVIICFLPVIADAVCCAAQMLIYKRSKRLLLKGFCLHTHFLQKNQNAYGVIIGFAIAVTVCAFVALAYAKYCGNMLID